MAVLGKIRSLGPVALISVIGLALFAFVFSTGSGTVTDVFKADEFNQSRVAIVNGIEMDRTDFMNTVDNMEKQNRGSRSSIQAMNRATTCLLILMSRSCDVLFNSIHSIHEVPWHTN